MKKKMEMEGVKLTTVSSVVRIFRKVLYELKLLVSYYKVSFEAFVKKHCFGSASVVNK